MDRARIRRPNPKSCAVGDEIGSHRRIGANMTQGSGNGMPLTDPLNSGNRDLFQTGRSPSILQRVRSADKSISIGALQLLLGDWCYRSWII